MTTVVFPDSQSDGSLGPTSNLSLRQWLGECWAILFSHPGDFDQEQLERDRWLSVLSRTFDEHGVRAVALARDADDAQAASLGWLAALSDGAAAVLSTAAPAQGSLGDFRACPLGPQVSRGGTRFAMVIDPDLRCRRLARYHSPVDLPSPIELVGWAVALRDRQHPTATRHSRPR